MLHSAACIIACHHVISGRYQRHGSVEERVSKPVGWMQVAAGKAEGGAYAGPGNELGLGAASVRQMAALDAWALRRVLLRLARRFPRTLEAFLTIGLTPAAAELLTARFEAADAQLAQQGEGSLLS